MAERGENIERAAFAALMRWTDEHGRDRHGELRHGGRTPLGVAWDVFDTRDPDPGQLDAVCGALDSLERAGAAIRVEASLDGRPERALYVGPSSTDEGVAYCQERAAHADRVAELWRQAPLEDAATAADAAERDAAAWRAAAVRWRDAEGVRAEFRAAAGAALAP